jgi:hypothetical protein
VRSSSNRTKMVRLPASVHFNSESSVNERRKQLHIMYGGGVLGYHILACRQDPALSGGSTCTGSQGGAKPQVDVNVDQL